MSSTTNGKYSGRNPTLETYEMEIDDGKEKKKELTTKKTYYFKLKGYPFILG